MDLEKVFASISEMELAYQFGSSVKHPGQKAGGVDVAVLLERGVSAQRQFEIYDFLTDPLKKYSRKKWMWPF